MSLTLFISRQLKEDSPLLQLEDIDIYADSQIEIIIHQEIPDVSDIDWIFFSSGSGVNWALENKLDLNRFKIAAIGTATASKLKTVHVQVDFVGNDGESIEEISEKFSDFVSGEKVLFPMSSLSKKTILERFTGNYDTFVAYTTDLTPFVLEEDMDIYVFTSPSNFQSFYQANKIDESKLVIAIGDTTKAEIEKSLNIPIFTPKEKTESSIYELLKDLIPSHFS